jgi:phosphate transport system permease protein
VKVFDQGGEPVASPALLEEIPPEHRVPIAGVREAIQRHRARGGGRAYTVLRWLGALVFAAVLLALVITLVSGSSEAFRHSGLRFLWSGTWNDSTRSYGAGVFVVGTLVTTFMALLLAVPIGVASAAYLSEMAPRRLTQPLSVLIDLIAAVPSIVVGLWGLLVLVPLFEHHVEPWLSRLPLVGRALFVGQPLGSSLLLASVVLAVMILPTVVALSRTALSGVEVSEREAARALGATRWQVTRRAVVPGARSGIEAAVTLAMGRALGETIAVAMVIGNRFALPHSISTVLLSPGATLGSGVINTFGEATPGLQRSAVIAVVVYLFAISVAVNAAGQLLLRRRRRQAAKGLLPA